MAAFKASARSLDQGIGAVLNGLHQLELNESTLIICTTDHGLAFPTAKATLFDRGIGVMMLMRGPGGFTGGKVFDQMVSQLDVYPTLCELAGVEIPEYAQGHSLLPLIRGDTDRLRDQLFTEFTYHAAYEPQRAVRTDRWKYIRRFGSYPYTALANCDDSATKEVLVEAGWGEQLVEPEQLYDLVFDPHEERNLVDDTGRAEVLTDLRQRLDRWMKETSDPLLDGPVGAPPGAEFNLPSQVSADDPTVKGPADPEQALAAAMRGPTGAPSR